MKLIHMQTTVQAVFGVDDGEGNAIPQEPVTVNVPVFTAEAFAEAFEAIKGARDQALANSEPPPAEQNGGNRAQRRAAAHKKPARA